MSSYSSLHQTVELIVDAAIEAEMSFYQYFGDVHQGFTHQGPYVYVTPPGGERRSVGGNAVDAEGFPVSMPDGFHFGRDVYLKWRRLIRGAFEDWLDLPDPAGFDSQIDRVERAAFLLSSNTSVDGRGRIGGANPELRGLETLRLELAPFSGVTMDTFSAAYANPLPGVVRGQFEVAAFLVLMATAEQQVWERARADVADIADKVLEAMRAAKFQAGGGFGWKSLLTVGWAIGAAVALFATGGTAAPVIAGATTGLEILSVFVPEHESDPKPEVEFGGSDPDEVYAKIEPGLAELNRWIRDQERKIGEALDRLHLGIIELDGDFNLAPPDGLLREEDRSDLITFEFSTLRWLATDIMPGISAQLRSATTELGPVGSSAWVRPSAIGYGAKGPFREFDVVRDHLASLTDDTAWELVSAADHLSIATNDLAQGEASVAAALHAHRVTVANSGVYMHHGQHS